MDFSVDTSIPIMFEKTNDATENDEDMFYNVKIYLAHTETNKNRSHFTEELLTSMSQESLGGIPICGYIQVKSDNTLDFKGHEERIIVEKNNIMTEYIGRAYGFIKENPNARFEDRETPSGIKKYLVCDGKLWRKFSSSIDIFENNDGVMRQSMEINRESVEGYVKDKIFYFTKAKFEAACIISHDIGVGMEGSTIEKFSLSTIQTQFQEMLQEYTQFTANSTIEGGENLKNENKKSEGDVTMELLEQKNSLFSKFTNLVDEDVQDIKSNLDRFSLEDLEIKLKELSDAKFALTYNQLESEIRKELRFYVEEIDDFGYKYSTQVLYFADIKDNLVICRHTNWTDYYGVPYTSQGDSVILDYDAKIPYMADWRPKVEGDIVSDFTAEDIKSRMDAFAESVKAQYSVDTPISVIESEEYKTLQSEFELLKSTNEKTLENFTALTTQLENLQAENSQFAEEKIQKEQKEKVDLINSDTFKLFTEDDKKPFLEKVDQFTMDELKNQMFLALGMKASQFTFTGNTQNAGFTFEQPTDSKVNEKSYASIIREKVKK